MQSRKEVCSNSSRWQPTKEQVEILESVYSSGVKTPSAEQIQQITARLSVYGEIEGKNVFYWFQNTKARRRQKVKEDRRLAYLSRFCPPLFPGYVPPILPNGVVSEMAGYYYYPCGGGMVLMDSTRAASRERKTLELFPLHPEAMAEDEDRFCYGNCAMASATYGDDDNIQGPGFIDFFSGNGCSSATTTITDQ